MYGINKNFHVQNYGNPNHIYHLQNYSNLNNMYLSSVWSEFPWGFNSAHPLKDYIDQNPAICNQIAQSVVSQNKLKPHVCETCGSRYASNYLLKRHMNETPCSFLLAQKAPYEFRCSICDLPIKTRQSLIRHNKNIHGVKTPRRERKVYVCPICGYDAKGHKTKLVTHLRTHTGEKPYSCKGCGKSQACESNHYEHVRGCELARAKGIFLPSKRQKHESGGCDYDPKSKDFMYRYNCSKCNYKSKKKVNRDKHERIHGDQFPCYLCPTGFKTSNGLAIHLRLEH